MEAGDYQDPVLRDLEEYSVREPAYGGTAPSTMDDAELQRMER